METSDCEFLIEACDNVVDPGDKDCEKIIQCCNEKGTSNELNTPPGEIEHGTKSKDNCIMSEKPSKPFYLVSCIIIFYIYL